MIVDVHTHIFPYINGMTRAGPTHGLGYGRAAIGSESFQLMPPLNEQTIHTAEMLIAQMDWASVDKAVLLQGPFYGDCNHYVLEAVEHYPDRLVGAAFYDPWSPHAREMLDFILNFPAFRAVKLEYSVAAGLCGIHPEARLDSPEITWLWDLLEHYRLVLVLDLGAVGSRSYQTDAVCAIAKGHPSLRIVIAHLAQPTPVAERDPTLWHTWQEQIDLGQLPNVWFDNASVIAYLHEEGYPYPSAERYMRLAIERIGPTKLMWGTDIPGNLVYANYQQLVTLARLHTQFLSSREQALVLGENAIYVFN